MTFIEQNLKAICAKYGLDFYQVLSDFGVESAYELALGDIEALLEEYQVDLHTFLFKPLLASTELQQKLAKIKLVILDVDGVMTDGGMFVTESGDHFKRFDTKDGRGIMNGIKAGYEFGIISSGFKAKAVEERAKMLGIQNCHVGLEEKLDILNKWCSEKQISLDQVAMIGDDTNDLKLMQAVGVSACPVDAVLEIKNTASITLTKQGGKGCVREFVDFYLTKN